MKGQVPLGAPAPEGGGARHRGMCYAQAGASRLPHGSALSVDRALTCDRDAEGWRGSPPDRADHGALERGRRRACLLRPPKAPDKPTRAFATEYLEILP